MKRQLILLSVLIIVGVAAGGYGLEQWWEKEKVARASELAKKNRQQMLEQQDKLVSEARAWLDEWAGQGELLVKAAGNLDRVLKVNPKNAQARIERARLHIKAGHINYRNFRPGALDSAAGELRMALHFDPNSADAYILLGHLHFLNSRPKDALTALEKAEAIGTGNPWLYLNWADALMDLNRWSEAELRLRKAQAQFAAMANPPRAAARGLHEKLVAVLVKQRNLDEADKAYQAAIAFDPTHAWTHGNYADFLLFGRGMPDAAIVEAEKALKIMNYGMARLALAAAHYAKWAEFRRKSPEQAREYLALAQAGAPDFSWIMPQAAKSVSAGPAIQNMVKELVSLGVPLDTKDENGDTGLTLAADAGNLESVLLLIEYGANIEAADQSGLTVLGGAANKGHTEVAKALVGRGAKVNARDKVGRTPLFTAAFNGDEEMFRTLISLKADPNIAMTNGFTPLMSAAFKGHEGLVRLLLQAGADPSPKTTDSQLTAADLATQRGFLAMAQTIREAAEKRAPTGR